MNMYFYKRFDYKFRVLSTTSIKFNIMDQCLSLSITDHVNGQRQINMWLRQSFIDWSWWCFSSVKAMTTLSVTRLTWRCFYLWYSNNLKIIFFELCRFWSQSVIIIRCLKNFGRAIWEQIFWWLNVRKGFAKI